MLQSLAILGAILAAAVACVLVLAALKPTTFSVQRSLAIDAPAVSIFPLINTLSAMNTWNPFAEGLPSDAIAYSGPEAGPGAAFDWDVPGRAGAGRIEITAAKPGASVDMNLLMRRPMAASNKVRFLIEPAGSGSRVTWSMTGPWPYMHRVMGTLFSMDKMVGGSFEKGLGDLKRIAESGNV